MLAIDAPEAFGSLVDAVAETDLARTELALATPGVDLVVARGWYSSTELWSPDLFDRFVCPSVKALAGAAHRHGKKFCYVMTTGLEILGTRLADAGVDVVYFVDPLQGNISLERARDLLGDRMTMVGGVNSFTLQSEGGGEIRDGVRRAIETLGPTNRFILHPVDALFPETPWANVEAMIEAWEEFR